MSTRDHQVAQKECLETEMQALTFRRWFPYGPKKNSPDVSWTFPIDTTAQKILLAEFVLREKAVMSNFVEGRMDSTNVLVEAGDDASLHVKDALQFFLEGYNDDGELDDGQDASLTFLLSTPAEKLAFADWLIEHKLGDFRQENTHVFVGQMHATAVGKSVLVPVVRATAED